MATLVEFSKVKLKMPKEPLIKEFFDLDGALNKHLRARLPLMITANMKINKVFKSKDETVHRFRVNYIDNESGTVRKSYYVEIETNTLGEVLKFTEK